MTQISIEKAYITAAIANTDQANLLSRIEVEKAYVLMAVRKREADEFYIEGDTLKVFAPTAGSKSVDVRVTDGSAVTFDKNFSITVT